MEKEATLRPAADTFEFESETVHPPQTDNWAVLELVGVAALDATKDQMSVPPSFRPPAPSRGAILPLDLGTEFTIFPMELAENRVRYTVQQLISALEKTKTLTKLVVYCDRDCEPPLIHRRIVDPLCRCIANLRVQNEHHPLKEMHFQTNDSDTIRQLLVALKQFGIPKVVFFTMQTFPIHFLMEFCHDNSNLKVLELDIMKFTDAQVVADPSGGTAFTMNLDKLGLTHVEFKTSTAATNFAHWLSHMKVSDMELGRLFPRMEEMGQNVEFDEDILLTKRSVSGFTMPSVEQLTLYHWCGIKHFQAALDAGMTTVKRLTVQLAEYSVDGATEKLESLTRMIRGAVKLNSLTIRNRHYNRLSAPRQFFQDLDACASVTEIHLNKDDFNPHDFTESEERQLRRITTRNIELGHFVANPSTFPKTKLLTLMRQFNKCPTGLYLLTLRLPEVFSFEKGNSLFPLMVEPNPTRKLRKKRKIS